MAAALDRVKFSRGDERRHDLMIHQGSDGVVVAGYDQRGMAYGVQPRQARPARERSKPVHNRHHVLRALDVHRADKFRLAAQAAAEHGPHDRLQPFGVVAVWLDEMPERHRVPRDREGTMGGRDQDQPANPVRVGERHLLRDRAAERHAEHVGGVDAQFVEHRGAEPRQVAHGHRHDRPLRPADARRVECDSAEAAQMGQQVLP